MVSVAPIPGDISNAFSRRQDARAVQHRRGEIDAGRAADMRREGADDEARTAGDIKHIVNRLGAGALDDPRQHLVVGDHRGGAEGQRLTGELIEDQLAVRGLAHSIPIKRRTPTAHRNPHSMDALGAARARRLLVASELVEAGIPPCQKILRAWTPLRRTDSPLFTAQATRKLRMSTRAYA